MRKYMLSKTLIILAFFTSLIAMQSEDALNPSNGKRPLGPLGMKGLPPAIGSGFGQTLFSGTSFSGTSFGETPVSETPYPRIDTEETRIGDAPLSSESSLTPTPFQRSLAQTAQALPAQALPTQSLSARGYASSPQGWMGENSGTKAAVLSAAPAAAMILAYKNNEKFRAYVNKHSGAAKNYVLRNVALPTAMKIEEIKTEGFSRSDVLKGVLVGVGLFALKKAGDYLYLWNSLRTGDFTKTREAVTSLFTTLYDNKKKIVAGVIAGVGIFWLWKFSRAINKQAKVPLLDQFFLSLTQEQRIEIMQNAELQKLVAEAGEDPLPLQCNEQLMRILNDEQRKKLNAALEDYIKNNVPLAFLEGDLG